MSNRDFTIGIDISNGFEEIEKIISSFPVSVEIRTNENGRKYIHQNRVSTVSGIVLDDEQGNIQSYGVSSLLSEGETDELLVRFSEFFKKLSIPHKIIEIYHEVDWDKEVLSYEWSNT